jgi:glycosyltransferase involved in cell wall biosynthesis
MKNICFFNSHKVWGGGEKWHYEMVLRLRQVGYQVLVLTNRPSELAHRIGRENIPLHQVRISNLSFLNGFKILYIRNLLKHYQIQTIFLNAAADVKVAGMAAKLAGVEKIIYRRGVALPVSNTVLNRWLFRRIITDIITNSEESGRILLQQNSRLIPKEKVKIIYNGIDLQTYDQEQVRPVYTREGNEIVLGHAGRLAEEKGQNYLVELASILKAHGAKFTLLIAGKGKLAAPLKHYARKLGVEKEVRFLGFVENIKSFMESIDILVLPSLYEGAANVLLETMAARKPAVAFNVSSNPEFIVHQKTGLLAKNGDLADLAGCVKTLLQDEMTRKTFGRQARKMAEEKFDIRRVVKEVTRLIEE